MLHFIFRSQSDDATMHRKSFAEQLSKIFDSLRKFLREIIVDSKRWWKRLEKVFDCQQLFDYSSPFGITMHQNLSEFIRTSDASNSK